jgi:hypothetical protein
MKTLTSFEFKVGDVVVPSDGSNYEGKIIYISKEEDTIKHQCTKTGKIYEKSFFGFFCRYTLWSRLS